MAKKVTLPMVERCLARNSLLEFTKYTHPDYEANWHHEVLCQALDEWAFGDLDRLMVFMPPRHGKSELVSRRLPAYIFGREPGAKIITATYGADLAQMMNRDVQKIIDTPEYVELFHDTRLAGMGIKTENTVRNASVFEIVDHGGIYISAGVGGAITGMGFDYGIIDDPYKNRADANSSLIRRRIWDWFVSTFYTRQQGKRKILLTMTRWHEDDLAGELLERASLDTDADQWRVISFPAIAERAEINRCEGQALWPNRYDVEQLKKTKAVVGTYEWNALYQQHPSPLEGGIINRRWWQFYRTLPPRFDVMIQSWDMAFKGGGGSDYVVGQVWGRIGADKYLVDQVRGRYDFVQTLQVVKALSAKWPQANAKMVEDTANGPAIISSLKREISGLIPVVPLGSKESRLSAVAPEIEAGNVFLPESAPWIKDFMEEVHSFPNGLHDDQVDAMSQALMRFAKSTLRSMNKQAIGI